MVVTGCSTSLTGRVGRSYSVYDTQQTISVTLYVFIQDQLSGVVKEARVVCLTEWDSVGCRSVWLEVRPGSITYLLASGKGLLFVFLSLDVGEVIAADRRAGLLSP